MTDDSWFTAIYLLGPESGDFNTGQCANTARTTTSRAIIERKTSTGEKEEN
jgi:hypothetical protein